MESQPQNPEFRNNPELSPMEAPMLSGKQANCFSLGASWAPKTKLLGAQSKTNGPNIRWKMKLISIPYRIAKRLLYSYFKSETLKICIPLIIYRTNSIWN